MKLSQSTAEGITLIDCKGEISRHDVDVLRAGLSNALKSGKNKIVFEITESEKLAPEVIREISRFDLLARELAGRIVLLGNPALKAAVLKFAQPPVIECFVDRETALQHFRPKPKAPPAPSPAPKPEVAPSNPEAAKQYKADIRLKELSEATDLKKRVSQLENENELLKKQLQAVFVERREPATDASRKAQLQALEQRLEELLNQAKATAGTP